MARLALEQQEEKARRAREDKEEQARIAREVEALRIGSDEAEEVKGGLPRGFRGLHEADHILSREELFDLFMLYVLTLLHCTSFLHQFFSVA